MDYYPQYMEMLGAGAVMVFALVMLAIGIVLYVLYALGLSRMAQNKGLENPWMAWVPIVQLYLLGQVIETIDIGSNKIENAGLILVVGAFAGFVPVIGPLLSIAYLILSYFVYYKLYKMYAPGSEVLFLVITILTGSAASAIFIFILRDKTPVEII